MPGTSFPGSPFSASPSSDSGAAARLTAAYTELGNLLTQGPDVVTYLQQVADSSVRVLPAPTECGITLRRGHEVSTVAATGGLAPQADEIQYETGQGPCLDAVRTGTVVDVPELAAETRWDKYRTSALAHGVASSLSVPLIVDDAPVGALNMYSTRPRHFGAPERAVTESFAQQAAALLTVVLRQANDTQVSDQLQEALLTRAVIDQAMGIVMAQQRCAATGAFDLLRKASQDRNQKMADVAADLIHTTTGHRAQPGRPFTHRG